MKVYVCYASTGKYDDYREIMLHGYLTKSEAQAFVDRSEKLFRERWDNVSKSIKYSELVHWFPDGWHPECPDLATPEFNGFQFDYYEIEIHQKGELTG